VSKNGNDCGCSERVKVEKKENKRIINELYYRREKVKKVNQNQPANESI
jgi:hypothetical protein